LAKITVFTSTLKEGDLRATRPKVQYEIKKKRENNPKPAKQMKDQTLQQIEVRFLLHAPVLPQLLRVAVHGAQRICREAPMAGSKAQEVAASVTSESLVFKTACLHIEAVNQRRQESASKLQPLSWRQT
jgi:hypothetical protein